MKKRFLFTAVTLLTSSLFGSEMCCEDTSTLSGEVSYLYWKPHRSEIHQKFDNLIRYSNLDYDSGIRAAVSWEKDCSSILLRYTDFSTKDLSHLFAESDDFVYYELDYKTFDLELSHKMAFQYCPDVSFDFFLGLENIRVNEKIEDDENEQRKMKVKGLGPYLGVEFRYAFDCVPISFLVRGSSAVILGNAKLDSIDPDYQREKLDMFFVKNTLFGGVAYTFPNFSCFSGELSLGYEVQSWKNWKETDTRSEIESFGIGGFILSAALSF